MDGLTAQEFLTLVKLERGMYLSKEEKDDVERIKEKNKRVLELIKDHHKDFDVYLTGHIDFDNLLTMYEIYKELKKRGVNVYYPGLFWANWREKGEIEYKIKNNAKILLVITQTISFGTSVDVGFFIHRKINEEEAKIVFCYTGPSYEFESLKTHPASIYIDYFTRDIEDAIEKTLEFLSL
ncbi:hypothetical protein PFDSM3638_10050 [Pyrococcus furiosus DSM 3638]|uniref:Uncharacterized protein n=3 Tax=Pyrococcus furiosus TaxID=2261 RepID=A0A5C0XTF3_PYRFU|nr:hypothetical protein [Pyrococcus furiosus]AAL82119.1 hypothetical protein PF1995 [Pyrococcus furiosus DSM 3638]AFN04648.1 hypothetical protein PFC_08590 [Pyrococcus furiosus COM1]QEK79588.1 hypothetical protein PFDSM3638_10050 [Pyrococcus furiosus DSM 3638]